MSKANREQLTLVELKTCSEIFSNFAQPIATVLAAMIAVWGAKEVVNAIVSAPAPPAAIATPPHGTAMSVPDREAL